MYLMHRNDDYEDNDSVEIQEPAMREIRRTSSCFKRTCFSSCGCITVIAIVVIFGLWLFTPPQPKQINALPDSFPKDIQMYKQESVVLIEYIDSDRKKRGPETAALIPKIVLAPVFLALEETEETTSTAPGKEAGVSAWHAFRDIVTSHISVYKHTVSLIWKNLSADPDFIDEWYQNELRKQDYKVGRQFASTTVRIIDFNKGDIHGIVTIEDESMEQGTDRVKMTVDYQ